MTAELGHFLLWLALGLSLVLGVVPIVAAHRGWAQGMAFARPATRVLFVLVAASMVCLGAGFVNHDFTILYVANHSNTALPLAYRVAGIWGGPEGSLL